jgi:Domain of unknown function (DUF4157)
MRQVPSEARRCVATAVTATPVNDTPPIVHDVLGSSGRPLSEARRAFMEPRFGHDFSHVRVHTDAQAAESARAVNALAYAIGGNETFAAGQYQPTSETGRRLLAHELTHCGTATARRGRCPGSVVESRRPGRPCRGVEVLGGMIPLKKRQPPAWNWQRLVRSSSRCRMHRHADETEHSGGAE